MNGDFLWIVPNGIETYLNFFGFFFPVNFELYLMELKQSLRLLRRTNKKYFELYLMELKLIVSPPYIFLPFFELYLMELKRQKILFHARG